MKPGTFGNWCYSPLAAKAFAIEKIGREAAEIFFKNEIIKELLTNRNRQLARIIKNVGVTDAFGVSRKLVVPVQETEKKQKIAEYNAARCLLAREVQSHEVKAMRYVAERINANTDVLPVLWLHDGIYLAVTNHKVETRRYIKDIKIDVDIYFKDTLGFETELEVDRPEDHTTEEIQEDIQEYCEYVKPVELDENGLTKAERAELIAEQIELERMFLDDLTEAGNDHHLFANISEPEA